MKCKGTKADGTPCEANAVKDSEFCYFHNPDISDEEKREAQTKGGVNRALTIANPLPAMQIAEPEDAITLITDTINRVRAGELDIRTANCLGFLADKLLNAFEVVKLKDKVEFIERVIGNKKKIK